MSCNCQACSCKYLEKLNKIRDTIIQVTKRNLPVSVKTDLRKLYEFSDNYVGKGIDFNSLKRFEKRLSDIIRASNINTDVIPVKGTEKSVLEVPKPEEQPNGR
jgi:hypothetical protein